MEERDKPEENSNYIEELLQYTENPFDNKKSPADVMRIFFSMQVPLIPVISQRDMLIGILSKERLTAVMSDIERMSYRKIDRIITDNIRKYTFEEILPIVAKVREFPVINIFGEMAGKWSRVQLLAACDNTALARMADESVARDKEDKKIEWLVYLILEHIPRPLFAINSFGKMIFYNSHFEDMLLRFSGASEVDVPLIEREFTDASRNSFTDENGSVVFYNKYLSRSYERVPLESDEGAAGYLFYFSSQGDEGSSGEEKIALSELLDHYERSILVKTLQNCRNDPGESAASLKISRQMLDKKLKKHAILLPSQ